MNRITIALVVFILSYTNIAQASQTKLQVGVTFSLYGEIVQLIGGEHVEVVLISSEAQDALTQCDLVFRNGLGFDTWLDKTPKNGPVFTLTDGLPLLKVGQPFHNELALPHTDIASLPSCCQEDAKRDNQIWSDLVSSIKPKTTTFQQLNTVTDNDPHVWLDTNNIMSITVTISELLADYDPEHADDYDRRSDLYIQQLQALKEWIFDEVQAIPPNQRLLITAHDRFRYFGKQFGFIMPLHFPHAQLSEEATKQAKALVKELNIQATFLDGEPRPAFTAFNQSLGLPQPNRLLIAPTPTTPTYIKMMRHNVEHIINALENP